MDNHRLILAIALVMFTGCGICRKAQEPQIIIRDSIHTEIHEHYIHDSVKVTIPEIVEKVVTRDTASHLENAYAVSDAVVTDGYLHHSLRTKPQTIVAPVDIAVTDTTTYHEHSEVTTQTVTEYVEKELNWWQKFRLKAFWWLIAIGLIGWRREIIALIKKLIKLF